MLDTNIFEKPKDYITVGGETMTVDTPDETTVVFNLPVAKAGPPRTLRDIHYAQGFQPKHFLGKFHPAVNPDADKYAQSLGFENGYDAIAAYYGNSDWTDTPSPLLSRPAIAGNLPQPVVPTLESHIYITDTTEGRHLVANPYFHQVDPTGQQLPYISEQDELYKNDNEVRLLSIINGEVDYKSVAAAALRRRRLLDGQDGGNYTVDLRPEITIGVFGFNVTHEDEAKRAVFGDVRFREAMSLAINRAELNEVGFFGQGTPQQYIGFSPKPGFVSDKWQSYMTEFDAAGANSRLVRLA